MEQTPYGNSALWNSFNPKSVYNPKQKALPIDIVAQQGGVSNWIQQDLGINANNMSEQELLDLNNKYERATTDLGGNWERQRVIDKTTGQDVASNDYYHAPTNVFKDYILPTAGIFGAGLGFDTLMSSALGGAGAGSIGANVAGHGAWLGEGAAAAGGTGAAASGGAGGLGSMYALGGTEAAGSGLLAGTGTTGLQASLGPGLSLAAPTGTGMGLAVPGVAAATGGMGAMDVLKGLGKALIGGQTGGISSLGNLASLFTNYKQYSNTGDLMDEIKSIYSPDGVYAKELEKQLARRDAAAGRNSQYGPRLAELMARLGDSQARSLSGLGGMMSTQQGGLNGMVGAGSRLLESTGALERLFSIFGD